MRSAVLLAAALAAGCGKPNPQELKYLEQLRTICAGLPAHSATLGNGIVEFVPVPVNVISDGGICSTSLLPPQGSACPTGAGAITCRLVWAWHPFDLALCSPVGDCYYRCEAFAPGTQAGLPPNGSEVICATVSSGP
jgi:hypothetical protein